MNTLLATLLQYWWVILVLGGALFAGIRSIIYATKDAPKRSEPAVSAQYPIEDAPQDSALRALAEHNAATVMRLEQRVDELTARLESVEKLLRDVG